MARCSDSRHRRRSTLPLVPAGGRAHLSPRPPAVRTLTRMLLRCDDSRPVDLLQGAPFGPRNTVDEIRVRGKGVLILRAAANGPCRLVHSLAGSALACRGRQVKPGQRDSAANLGRGIGTSGGCTRKSETEGQHNKEAVRRCRFDVHGQILQGCWQRRFTLCEGPLLSGAILSRDEQGFRQPLDIERRMGAPLVLTSLLHWLCRRQAIDGDPCFFDRKHEAVRY